MRSVTDPGGSFGSSTTRGHALILVAVPGALAVADGLFWKQPCASAGYTHGDALSAPRGAGFSLSCRHLIAISSSAPFAVIDGRRGYRNVERMPSETMLISLMREGMLDILIGTAMCLRRRGSALANQNPIVA